MRRASLALLLVVLAACGVPSQHDPSAIDRSDVPFDLLAPTASVTSTTAVEGTTNTTQATIYLAGEDGKLVSVRRQVRYPATAATVVRALLRGPTADETGRLSTAITSDTKLLGVDGPLDGLVTIDLSRQILDITGRQQILALGQVVYTVTSLPEVDRVLFKIGGKRREVPNGDGKLTSSPLGRLSYRALVNG